MKKTIKTYWVFIFMLFVTYNTYAQVAITNLDKVPQLKNGTTYIVMKDPGHASVKEYVEMFKSTWTISKVQFIKYNDIGKYYKEGNFFLTIGGYLTADPSQPMFGGYIGPNGVGETTRIETQYTQIYLELWTCTEKFLQSDKAKPLSTRNIYRLARIDLQTTYAAICMPKLIYNEEYSFPHYIRNWGPGILKNYVESLMTHLNTDTKEKGLYAATLNQAALSKLKSEVLYVPDYVLIQFDKKNCDESKKHLESDIFGDYKLQYKLLSTTELNTKILTEKEPFYYLIYVKSCVDKFICVVNSQTGEMVYSKYYPMSYNIKSGDLVNLQKQILSE